MTLDLKIHGTAPLLVLVAALAACGPGKSGTTDTTDTSTTTEPPASTGTDTDTGTTAATTDPATTDPSPTDPTPTTTGGDAPALCADARTEADCLKATEMDEDLGLGCRWAEVLRFAPTDGADGCGFEPAGGVCVLASFEEGGAGCEGFWRDLGPGQIDFARWDCGTPEPEEWQGCFEIEMDSPGFAACLCQNGGGE
ncbi:hypothetical protein OV203_36005 [Nannocystis sp. ILAH1]|uniref:hypothetical protein n=1 Tax=unclassified Nannocystis TaxID=2627009 RepID=UPI002270A096|nr:MULTISPECIES: hypothetical protein [unclassified Nannocystis]MCY0992600.1 hypothetical protein [Nannocystis sp. ILAH1]MCY1070174.1 hypothetical protein [Nannocystis sp. RBIL2]